VTTQEARLNVDGLAWGDNWHHRALSNRMRWRNESEGARGFLHLSWVRVRVGTSFSAEIA
jgi:hypothetical protein